MVYVIIALALLFIIVPIIAVLPSARQRSQMRMHNEARQAGVTVELTRIDDPNPRQEKYISNTGRPIPPVLRVAAWRLSRPRLKNWRMLPRAEWCMKKRLDAGWQWDPEPPATVNPALVTWLNEHVALLPADVAQVEEVAHTVTVYWHERDEQTAQQVIEFLKNCIAMSLHHPDSLADD